MHVKRETAVVHDAVVQNILQNNTVVNDNMDLFEYVRYINMYFYLKNFFVHTQSRF